MPTHNEVFELPSGIDSIALGHRVNQTKLNHFSCIFMGLIFFHLSVTYIIYNYADE